MSDQVHPAPADRVAALMSELEAILRSSLSSSAAPEQGQVVVNATKPQPLLTTSDMCAVLRIGSRTLRRMCLRGDVPKPLHVGRLLRWDSDAVQEWLASGAPRRRVR